MIEADEFCGVPAIHGLKARFIESGIASDCKHPFESAHGHPVGHAPRRAYGGMALAKCV